MNQKTLADTAKVDRTRLNKFLTGKSGAEDSTVDKIATATGRPVRELTGEEPGASEARAKLLISDNILDYLSTHPEETQKTLAENVGISESNMNLIINQHIIPHKPTLLSIAKAIGGDNATIDDTLLRPLP